MKGMRFIYAMMMATLTSIGSYAQSLKPIYIDCNVGIVGKTSDDIADRENLRSRVDDDFYVCFDRGDAHVRHVYAEVKPEFMITRKLSADAGVRFTHSFGETTDDDLMWKVGEEGVNTYYATTSRVTQHAYYLGVPIGLRLAFADLDRVSPFLKVGASVNFKIADHNRVKMHDTRMSRYEDEIKRFMGRPKAVAVPIYVSGGIQCGPDGMINVEVMCPYFMKYANTFSMTKLKESGFGFSVGVRIPRINNY